MALNPQNPERNSSPHLISPFLNFDPQLLVSDPDDKFIFPDGQHTRARFERAFSEIGLMTIGGGVYGGARGFYRGGQDPTFTELTTWVQRRTHLLNHSTKNGTAMAQSFGSIALIYGLIDFTLQKARSGADDEINTVIATSSTGLLYKSVGVLQPGGWQRCLKGGLGGLLVGMGIVACTSWDNVKQILGYKS